MVAQPHRHADRHAERATGRTTLTRFPARLPDGRQHPRPATGSTLPVARSYANHSALTHSTTYGRRSRLGWPNSTPTATSRSPSRTRSPPDEASTACTGPADGSSSARWPQTFRRWGVGGVARLTGRNHQPSLADLFIADETARRRDPSCAGEQVAPSGECFAQRCWLRGLGGSTRVGRRPPFRTALGRPQFCPRSA
jgi:hypothetical protein